MLSPFILFHTSMSPWSYPRSCRVHCAVSSAWNLKFGTRATKMGVLDLHKPPWRQLLEPDRNLWSYNFVHWQGFACTWYDRVRCWCVRNLKNYKKGKGHSILPVRSLFGIKFIASSLLARQMEHPQFAAWLEQLTSFPRSLESPALTNMSAKAISFASTMLVFGDTRSNAYFLCDHPLQQIRKPYRVSSWWPSLARESPVRRPKEVERPNPCNQRNLDCGFVRKNYNRVVRCMCNFGSRKKTCRMRSCFIYY